MALFFGFMVRKMKEEATQPHSHMVQLFPRWWPFWNVIPSVSTISLKYSFLSSFTHIFIKHPLGMIYCSHPYCRPQASALPLLHLFPTYPVNSCLTPTVNHQCLIALLLISYMYIISRGKKITFLLFSNEKRGNVNLKAELKPEFIPHRLSHSTVVEQVQQAHKETKWKCVMCSPTSTYINTWTTKWRSKSMD